MYKLCIITPCSRFENLDTMYETVKHPSVLWIIVHDSLNCRAMMKPMLDTVFNRAKSNCSWIEATSAGMVLIAPNLPEFQRPGVVLTDHFFAGVKHVMEDDAYLEAFNLSKEYIKNNLLLSKVNELRENMLTQ